MPFAAAGIQVGAPLALAESIVLHGPLLWGAEQEGHSPAVQGLIIGIDSSGCHTSISAGCTVAASASQGHAWHAWMHVSDVLQRGAWPRAAGSIPTPPGLGTWWGGELDVVG